MRTLNDLHPKVKNLVDLLQVEVTDYNSLLSSGQQLPDQSLCCAAFYQPSRDYIAFNNYSVNGAPNDLNENILHEIVHYSGHSSRVARDFIVKLEKIKNISRVIYVAEEDMHTEEAIAQMGMYKLACALGLNKVKYKKARDLYLSTFWWADLDKAESESDVAVNYILELGEWSNCGIGFAISQK